MGNPWSKFRKRTPRPRPTRVAENSNGVEAAEPSSTEGMGESNAGEDDNELEDADWKEFDCGMKQRTEKVLGSLENGIKKNGLELSALREVTNGLTDMNEKVVEYILDCDLDVWANDDMKELVTDYFQNSLEALDFCVVLERSVDKARDDQNIIECALRKMPEEGFPSAEVCQQILVELDKFAQAPNPFSEEFQQLFREVYQKQKKLQEKLTERRKKYQRKEKNVRVMRKITTVILTASFISLVVCAAVAMAVASPMLPGGVSASASLPFEAMHAWLKKLWANYEQKIRAQRVIVEAAQWGAWIAITELDTINTEVKRVRSDIEGFIRNIVFAQERGDGLAVENSVRVLGRKQEQFTKHLEDLASHVSVCIKRINTARGHVLDCSQLANPVTRIYPEGMDSSQDVSRA